MAAELVALQSAALDLEQGLRELSEKTQPHDLREIINLVEHINAAGFAPIEALQREQRVKLPPADLAAAGMHDVLAEARVRATGAAQSRVGFANALSIVRRAVRYMEMYCSSTAETAMRLRLDDLAGFLRAWARDWIGLEVTLNAAASNYLPATAERPSRFSVPNMIRSLAAPGFAAA